jgi:hypothetical protein
MIARYSLLSDITSQSSVKPTASGTSPFSVHFQKLRDAGGDWLELYFTMMVTVNKSAGIAQTGWD